MDLNRKRMNAGITAEDNRSELSAGSTVTLEITAYGSEGQGIARHNGMAVFVPGAICGETVEAEIKKAAPSFAEAKLQKILRPSAERVIPPCPHYAECGGCDLLHMSYAEQLRMKRETVRSAMERIGGFRGIEILPCIGADKPEHYRNKAVFQFANAEKTNKKNLRQVLSGYYEQKSHKLVPVETCMIQNEEAMTAKRIVAEWANLFDIRAFDEKQKSGTLRQLMVRIHFIGHLQTNKVKYIIDSVSMIQSVDSIKLAEEIDRHAGRIGKCQDILIEVNIGGEKSKSGIAASGLEELVYQVSELENIRVRGLMAIPPAGSSERFLFDMQKLYIDISQKKIHNISMDYLSMGMSGDYEAAIKYGANMVRIGRGLFGPRNY